jgi:transposase InsO family protein
LLLEHAVWAQGCLTSPLALHADNGSAIKGATMETTLERLGVIPSFNRRERVNEEIRHRERVIRIFLSAEAALRPIAALLAE